MADLRVEVHRKTRGATIELAVEAAHLIETHLGHRLAPTRVIYTDSAGLAHHRWQWEQRLLPGMSSEVRRNRQHAIRAEAPGSAGVTLPGPGHDTLLLINTSHGRSQLGRTLIHEYMHVDQLADHAYRTEHYNYLAHAVGITTISRGHYRRHMRAMDRNETAAKRAEQLARHLNRKEQAWAAGSER